MINPKLNVGDRIVCYHMEDEVSVPPGTKGTVKKIQRDPFELDEQIISVDWDNGSTLAMLSGQDRWKLVKENVNEESEFLKQNDPHTHFLSTNKDLRKYFDLTFFRNYFLTLRDSGITNMWGAAPFVYMDKEHLDRYYGEHREDDENFQKLLEIQDDVRNKFLSSLVNYGIKNNVDLGDDSSINRLASDLAKKLVRYYMLFI